MVTEASQHTCSSVQEKMTTRDNPKSMLSQLSAGIQCLSLYFELNSKLDCKASKESLRKYTGESCTSEEEQINFDRPFCVRSRKIQENGK